MKVNVIGAKGARVVRVARSERDALASIIVAATQGQTLRPAQARSVALALRLLHGKRGRT